MATKQKNTKTNVPTIPEVPSDVSPAVKLWLLATKEALEVRLGRRGDPRDRAITLRELIESGLAKELRANPYDPNTDIDFVPWYEDPADLDIPPKPTNFAAAGAFTKIILTWTEGWTVFGNFGYTEIYRYSSDAVGSAIIIGTTRAGIFTDDVDFAETWFYWARHVSDTGVVGPFSDSATATTLADIGATMADLSETLAGLPGYSLLQTAAATIEIIQASGVPDENTNRANGSDPHAGDIYVNTATGQQYVRNAANNGWIIAVDAALTTTVNSQASSISTNASAISTANTNISNLTTTSSAHTTSITSINSTVAAKVDVYRQAAAPSGGTYVSGDLWVDTDDNQLYQYNGSAWVTARDVGLATATALSTVSSSATTANALAATKITTFRQNDIPVSLRAGDMWIDLNDSNKMYFAEAAGADAITSGEWVIAADSIITSAGASITTLETTTATLTGDAAAAYVLNVNANGSVAGMVIEANASSSGDNVGSAVQFMADKFAIWNATGSGSGSAAVAPFIVDSGVVYIDMARIKDGAIQTAKIGTAVIETALIADLAVTNIKIGDLAVTTAKIYDASITTAKIGNAAITNAKIAVAQIDTGHITNLYAHKLSGDVSKATSGTLASSIDFANRLANNAVFGWFDVLTLSLPKSTHPTGWMPYANFNINRVETDKNSWYHTQVEMAVWNVNSVGTTATETAHANNAPTAFGTGFTGATIYHDYLQFTPTYSNSNATLTISSSVFIQDVNSESGGMSALTSDLIAGNSAYLSDGTTRKQIESFLPVTSGGNITGYTFSYEDADTAPVSGWSGNQALYFSEAITSGSTGPYIRKSLIDWIAVDSAYNDFTIAGVWSDTAASANVTHGVKARLQYRPNHDGSWEQDVATMTLHEATGFLMGVR